MAAFFSEVLQTLAPRGDAKQGPLPPLLVALTLVTGLVDACSYLVLGHVFVANMTGNVVFLAFALVGAPGFSIAAALAALGAFVAGAFAGGILGARLGRHRGRLLRAAAALQSLLLGAAALLATLAGTPLPAGDRYGLIIVLGVAMGLQNAAARKLAVADLTTTVLTLTIVGLAEDSRLAGGSGSGAGRRSIAVATMFVGALIGTLLIVHLSLVAPLVLAFIVTALVALAAHLLSSADPAWVRAG